MSYIIFRNKDTGMQSSFPYETVRAEELLNNPKWEVVVDNRASNDNVNHPKHYTSHPSGVEVITITEHMNFCLGNVIKYVMRADLKNDAIEDLEKAAWYLNREIFRRTNADNR